MFCGIKSIVFKIKKTNRNLHNYILEEIINNEKIKHATKKKQKKECEALISVTRIKINHDSM